MPYMYTILYVCVYVCVRVCKYLYCVYDCFSVFTKMESLPMVMFLYQLSAGVSRSPFAGRWRGIPGASCTVVDT